MSNASRLGSLFKSGSLSQLGSFLGSIGIAGSLLLVAYELKQTRDIAVVQLASQRLDLQTRMTGRVNIDTQIALEGMMNYEMDKEMTSEHWRHAIDWSSNLWDGFALSHLTYEKGLSSEVVWEGQFREMQEKICDTETGLFFEMIANGHASTFTPSFAEVVATLITQTDCQIVADLGAAALREHWIEKTRYDVEFAVDRMEQPD